MDRRQERQELNKGFGDSLARAFELVLTPFLMGAFGWFLDSRLGTKPYIALFLFVFTVVYVIWKQLTHYDARMREQEATMLGRGK